MTGKSISTTPPDGVIEAISASHILHPITISPLRTKFSPPTSLRRRRERSWRRGLRVPSPVRYADILAALKALDGEGPPRDRTATRASLDDVQGPSRLKFS
ncbi:hypothetical protein [Rhizobium laguerreae]|uniref:hypothetical protein n=1 Tax=Rhizobium laguerreae TaxID=1076926 RepID=UPI0035E462DC